MYTYDELLISSPSPLFGQWEGGGSNFQAPNRDVVSLVTSAPPPIQETTKGHLIRIKDTPLTQDIPGDS